MSSEKTKHRQAALSGVQAFFIDCDNLITQKTTDSNRHPATGWRENGRFAKIL
jgi:hypothetical protein